MINTHGIKFRELGADHFIWLPLTSIPITDRIPVNSLKQPALKPYELVHFNAIEKFATDDQCFLAELAKSHEEMGYYLYHNGKDFGILGTWYNGQNFSTGQATIFNASGISIRDRTDFDPVMLELIGVSSVKFPYKGARYNKGDIAYYSDTYSQDFFNSSDDD